MSLENLKSELENVKNYFNSEDYAEITRLISKAEININSGEANCNKIPNEELKARAEKLKNLGNLDFKRKKYHDAMYLYSKAIDICPESVYYSNRAACLLKLGRNDEAISDCRRAIDIDPTLVRPYLRLGLLFLDNDFEKAEYYFQKAKVLEPENELCNVKLLEIQSKKDSRSNNSVSENKSGELNSKSLDTCFEQILTGMEMMDSGRNIDDIMRDPKLIEMAKKVAQDRSSEEIMNMFLKRQ